MTASRALLAFLQSWLAGLVGWWIGSLLARGILEYLVCELLRAGSYWCGMPDPSPLLASPLPALRMVPEVMLTTAVVGSVQLLLSLPGRYCVRERGLMFNGLIGAGCGLLSVLFFLYVAEGWRLGGRESGPDDLLLLLFLPLFFLTFWTLFPALLAAGVMRVGRWMWSRLGGVGEAAT